MSELPAVLAAALAEVQPLIASRGWQPPIPAALDEAARLLALTRASWPAPVVSVEPEGAVALAWEAAERGWLTLRVDGSGTVAHEGVLGGDEYALVEPWPGPEAPLPDWAAELLRRLWRLDA